MGEVTHGAASLANCKFVRALGFGVPGFATVWARIVGSLLGLLLKGGLLWRCFGLALLLVVGVLELLKLLLALFLLLFELFHLVLDGLVGCLLLCGVGWWGG